MADTVNFIFSSLAVVAQLLTIVLVFTYIKYRKNPNDFFNTIKHHGLTLAFIASLLSLVGSLLYSDVLGYEPCKFCWFQRILMYPQVLLLGIAMWKKDTQIALYSITLSTLGALLALNHYILQLSGTSLIPCSAVGYSVSCSKLFVLRFGYITIPLMAFSAFILMIISVQFARHNNAHTTS